MADLVHANYQLVNIMNRFGIEFGFGDKSVDQVCTENGVNTRFFIEIVNAYQDHNYYPEFDINNLPINHVLLYLSNAHKSYIRHKLPLVREMLEKLIQESKGQEYNMNLLKNFFLEYVQEVTTHIHREEEVVYPYVRNVFEQFCKEEVDKEFVEKMMTYSINDYLNEHDNIEEKLYDLKNIIIKYLPPPATSFRLNDMLFELFRLESDLNDHTRLEEKILIPMVLMMEESIRNKKISE